jgi:hypothetical protein
MDSLCLVLAGLVVVAGVGCSSARDTASATPASATPAPAATSTAATSASAAPAKGASTAPAEGARDFDAATREEAAGLRCTMTDARVDPTSNALRATFVLANTGHAPIHLYQRWNSWGAYQWRFAITDAAGARISAGNPQQAWTRNGPTAFTIEPGHSFSVDAAIYESEQADPPSGLSVFVAKAALRYPIRVRAVFESHPEQDPQPRVGLGPTTVPSSALWSGDLSTPWIVVAR